ncbi:MAG: cation transporter [bacterium]|nr:cation transporter [bacterium]
MEDRKKEIVNASWVGIIGNAFLSVLKITIGLIAGSLAVVGDGIDSASDIVTSLITLLTARIIGKPPDIKYPYGYERADTIAAKVLSFVIFFAGAQLAISTIRQIIENQPRELPAPLAIYITVISIVGKFLLARHQLRVGKKTQSAMLIANSKNMQNDVIISGGVLTGLFFTFILRLPILDTITALGVSIWIMKAAFEIFMQTNRELMDGTKNLEIYKKIFAAIDTVKGVTNPHKLRVRQLGSMYLIDVDIEVDAALTVHDAHVIAHDVEESIKKAIDNVYDIMIHVEPIGDDAGNEKFGVSKRHCAW